MLHFLTRLKHIGSGRFFPGLAQLMSDQGCQCTVGHVDTVLIFQDLFDPDDIAVASGKKASDQIQMLNRSAGCLRGVFRQGFFHRVAGYSQLTTDGPNAGLSLVQCLNGQSQLIVDHDRSFREAG